MLTDTELTRQLAALMGWRIYTEQNGEYNRWQRHLVDPGGADSCFVDLDGAIWSYAGACYTIGAECRWRPIDSMDDAWMVVEHLQKKLWGMTLTQIETTPEGRKRFHLDKWFCRFTGFDTEIETVADTPARAICLAALKTREEKPDA